METCQIDGCQAAIFVKSRGWCRKHYNRWYKTGDPLAAKFNRASGSPSERWLAKVNQDGPVPTVRADLGPCWLWTGSLDRHGYGQFDVIDDRGHKNHRAHRWGYQQLVRPLADDETLDHLCRVHECVRPTHLDPVPHAVNVERGEAGRHNAVKTHCAQGHPFDEENTLLRSDGRQCRTCRNKASRAANRRARGTAEDAVHNGDKTHCKSGHEFTPENTRIRPTGGRECKECARIANRESMRRRRAKQQLP